MKSHSSYNTSFLLQVLSLCFLLPGLACQKGLNESSNSFPNVLLILVDDMGFGDLSSTGNPYLQTPELDALKEKSVSFEHFYVSPVCAPTRASLLTGLYPQRSGVYSVTNGYESMSPEAVTLAELLKYAGYRTGLFGKWHLGEYYPMTPKAQGFDEFIGFRTGHFADYYDPGLENNGVKEVYGGYITDILSEKAIAFMESSKQPFFCYLSFNAPHTPLQIDSSYYLPFLNLGLDERTARVYGMVENIDQNIGQILQSLQQVNKLKETIVIFMSDNGPISGWRVPPEKMRYNAGLRDQKFTIYEGGIRTPSFWYWEQQWKPQNVDKVFAAHIDLVPTIMDVLNIKSKSVKRPGFDGTSLLPLLRGEPLPDSISKRILFQNYHLSNLEESTLFPGGIAMQWPFKMVEDSLLFNLIADPAESQNVATQYPKKLEKLQQAYRAWWKSLPVRTEDYPFAIPVGHKQENPVLLQPHHGKAMGQLQFLGRRGLLGERIGTHPSGVDGDWLGAWEKVGDGIRWKIDVKQPGRYQIGVKVRNPLPKEDISLGVKIAGSTVVKTIPASSLDQSWQEIRLLDLHLLSGIQTLDINLQAPLSDSNGFEMRNLFLLHSP